MEKIQQFKKNKEYVSSFSICIYIYMYITHAHTLPAWSKAQVICHGLTEMTAFKLC